MEKVEFFQKYEKDEERKKYIFQILYFVKVKFIMNIFFIKFAIIKAYIYTEGNKK
jgi:hypothetical protein